jgi:hypothetical protein
MKSRSQRIICFVVVLLAHAYFMPVKAQEKAKPALVVDFQGLSLPGEVSKNGDKNFSPKPEIFNFSGYQGMISLNQNEFSEKLIPGNYYYVHSGFFCKREWELEKATHIPFRFRLGSLDDCNVFEGKR